MLHSATAGNTEHLFRAAHMFEICISKIMGVRFAHTSVSLDFESKVKSETKMNRKCLEFFEPKVNRTGIEDVLVCPLCDRHWTTATSNRKHPPRRAPVRAPTNPRIQCPLRGRPMSWQYPAPCRPPRARRAPPQAILYPRRGCPVHHAAQVSRSLLLERVIWQLSKLLSSTMVRSRPLRTPADAPVCTV